MVYSLGKATGAGFTYKFWGKFGESVLGCEFWVWVRVTGSVEVWVGYDLVVTQPQIDTLGGLTRRQDLHFP